MYMLPIRTHFILKQMSCSWLYVLFMAINSIDSYSSERNIFGLKSSHVDQLHLYLQDFL